MTTTYDPRHPNYLDEADVRAEMTRVYDVCDGCRRCVELCTSFPTLFEMIERREGGDAGWMTPAEQDRVVDECFQCKVCSLNCPYTPDLHEWNVDFPRLMLRAEAVQHANGIESPRARVTSQLLGRTDLIGHVATSTQSFANKVIGAPHGSLTRKAVEKTVGVSSVRLLPPFSKQRFSTWFKKRTASVSSPPRGKVTVFPTCLVEYLEPGIGSDLVNVYERNGIECSLTDAGCCGAPWLNTGDIAQFTKVAAKVVRTLAAELRAGTAIVAPQPTCSYTIRRDYLDYVDGADARLVAANTYDATEYLIQMHGGGTALDTGFTGETFAEITYHEPCHLRAQNVGSPSRDLLQLTGAQVTVIQQCSGIGSISGLRSGNDDTAMAISEKLGEQVRQAGGDLVTGDCHLANTAITEQTDRIPQHPIQVLARAYGIAPAG